MLFLFCWADPIEVHLQITAFADMTLPEILKLMAEQRREEPDVTEFHDENVMRTRLDRYDQITAIGVNHNLPRSYSTFAECKAMAKAVFSGARMIRYEPQVGTTRPGEITRLQSSDGVYPIGGDEMLIDGMAEATDPVEETNAARVDLPKSNSASEGKEKNTAPGSIPSVQKSQLRSKSTSSKSALPRPKNLKGLN